MTEECSLPLNSIERALRLTLEILSHGGGIDRRPTPLVFPARLAPRNGKFQETQRR